MGVDIMEFRMYTPKENKVHVGLKVLFFWT